MVLQGMFGKLNRRDDIYYTPDYVIRWILPYLTKDKKIWECAAGEFNIVNFFKREGFECIGTELKYGFDFLEDTPNFEFDIIITNPPYSLKTKFIERCLTYKKPFALLLPITILDGKKNHNLLKSNNITAILPLGRIDFIKSGRKLGRPAAYIGWFLFNFNDDKFKTILL